MSKTKSMNHKQKYFEQKLFNFLDCPSQDKELKIEYKTWGMKFTLGTFHWIKSKVKVDAQSGALQAKLTKGTLKTSDLIEKSQIIFGTWDDEFEAYTDRDVTIYGYEDTRDGEIYVLVGYRDKILVCKPIYNTCSTSDLFEDFDLHGVAFYCPCGISDRENVCACRSEFCPIEDFEIITDDLAQTDEVTGKKETMMEIIERVNIERDIMRNYPKLPMDVPFEVFLGNAPKLVGDRTFMVDEDNEKVICPVCLESYKFEKAFSLYR